MINRKVILLLILMFSLVSFFWLGSRYPQLNEKALMADTIELSGLSFDMPYAVSKNNSVLKNIFYNTLNWLETNKKGMLFGLLFAAVLMILMLFLKEKEIKNRWLNTVFGVLIGAPLGVCVNCAAPIALGMKKSGSSSETAVATMISSPTLNVIVLTMLFMLFPYYLILTKLVATAILLFVAIPVLTKYFPQSKKNSQIEFSNRIFNKIAILFTPHIDNDALKLENDTWQNSIKWVFVAYLKYLWYVVKLAVPLMLLAGLLGNILITIIPFEVINQFAELFTGNPILIIIALVVVAIFGTILPVPISFDVILAFILFSLGFPVRYVAVLLFTLGAFSIYPYFIVHKVFNPKLALGIFTTVVALGIASGVIGHYWSLYDKEQTAIIAVNKLKYFKGDLFTLSSKNENVTLLKNEEVNSIFKDSIYFEKENINISGIDVFSYPFRKKLNEKKSNKMFIESNGTTKGIYSPYQFSVERVFSPYRQGRSVSSGDIHKDGFPDLVITSDLGIKIFSNLKGESFIEQEIEIPKDLPVLGASLVDLDNDGWLDIFITTLRRGNYIYWNKKGVFNIDSLECFEMPENHELTTSPAFSDINGDGKLDIFTGNWSLGFHAPHHAVPASKNYLFLSKENNTYSINSLDADDGETLSTLFSDFDGDGDVDLIVANDFATPNFIYINNNDTFYLSKKKDSIMDYSTNTSMSAFTSDLDNDGDFEILLSQISPTIYATQSDFDLICNTILDPGEKNYVKIYLRFIVCISHQG